MSDVRVDTSGLLPLKARISPARDKMVAVLAVQVMKDTDKYVPFLTGSFARRTRIQGSKIIYEGPYGRYLHEGKVMAGPRYGPKHATNKNLVYTKQHHAQAGSKWFDRSKNDNLQKWKDVSKKAFVKYVKR